MWGVITHPCLNINARLTEPLILRHELVITSHYFSLLVRGCDVNSGSFQTRHHFSCGDRHFQYYMIGRVTLICISKLTIMDQIMACRLVGTKPLSEPMLRYIDNSNWGTNFGEILSEVYTFIKKMLLKMSSVKWWPFCLGFIVLT